MVSLWLLCPSLAVSYRGIQQGVNEHTRKYILTWMPVETSFDHSLFGLIKQFTSHHNPLNELPPEMLTGYLACAAIAGIALYFLRIRHLPILNQLLALCILAILLPPNSHDYTLIHLYTSPGRCCCCFALRNAANPEVLQRLVPHVPLFCDPSFRRKARS